MWYRDITIAQAEEYSKYGYDLICDGDSKLIKYGTRCNHCNEYFISGKLSYICDDCKRIIKAYKEKSNREPYEISMGGD